MNALEQRHVQRLEEENERLRGMVEHLLRMVPEWLREKVRRAA